jgi:hypothetical protein
VLQTDRSVVEEGVECLAGLIVVEGVSVDAAFAIQRDSGPNGLRATVALGMAVGWLQPRSPADTRTNG